MCSLFSCVVASNSFEILMEIFANFILEMSAVLVGAAALIYFQINFLVLYKLDEIVDKPYMDEIFHVPQAQQYCLGNYNEVNLI